MPHRSLRRTLNHFFFNLTSQDLKPFLDRGSVQEKGHREKDGDSCVVGEEVSSGRLVIPSLILSTFATYTVPIVSKLILVEVGLAFRSPVGVMTSSR
jgi:hypothetical protein